jgi:hypothetical protein
MSEIHESWQKNRFHPCPLNAVGVAYQLHLWHVTH